MAREQPIPNNGATADPQEWGQAVRSLKLKSRLPIGGSGEATTPPPPLRHDYPKVPLYYSRHTASFNAGVSRL